MRPPFLDSQGSKVLWLCLALVFILALFVVFPTSSRPFFSHWSGPQTFGVAAAAQPAEGQPTASAIVAEATPDPLALDRYNQGSALQDADPDQRVRFYRRAVGGGSIAYFVITLDQQVHVEVLNADGATPGSDAAGDTIWTDGQRHLATVAQIAQAPYAARDQMTLLGAMAFGFHGDSRTSDEGTVVIDGTILRINSGRATLCITADGQAKIGLFDANTLRVCQQAIGAGPVILARGKIANPAVSAETDEFLPFNPLGEDFVQLDWRKMIYNGRYAKSVIGVGKHADGRAYLVMLISNNLTGIDVASQLKALGCTDALGGDDDSSTQAIWRGAAVQPNSARAVPDALAVYVRK